MAESAVRPPSKLCYNSGFPELEGWRNVMPWKSVAIIGVGLIGGSIGLALRRRGLADEVVGVGHRTSTLRKARSLGIVTRTTTNLKRGVAESELVVICTPVEMISGLAVEIARQATAPTLITDVGSTKSRLVDEIDRAWPESTPATFIGSHPLAGSEKTGPESARADLFDNRLVVVTPTARTPGPPLNRTEQFWTELGARVARRSPEEHDEILAATSHLPHLIASTLATITEQDQLPFTAGGWSDTTRIAGADPELWKQILLDNRRHVLKSLAKFGKVLAEFRTALADEDEQQLIHLLTAGKQRRDALGS
jgi:prephenate dehydrogenase